jgi:hypothetical protein
MQRPFPVFLLLGSQMQEELAAAAFYAVVHVRHYVVHDGILIEPSPFEGRHRLYLLGSVESTASQEPEHIALYYIHFLTLSFELCIYA